MNRAPSWALGPTPLPLSPTLGPPETTERFPLSGPMVVGVNKIPTVHCSPTGKLVEQLVVAESMLKGPLIEFCRISVELPMLVTSTSKALLGVASPWSPKAKRGGGKVLGGVGPLHPGELEVGAGSIGLH